MAAKKVEAPAVDSEPKSIAEQFPEAACRTGNLIFDEEGNILGEVEEVEVVEEAPADEEQSDTQVK